MLDDVLDLEDVTGKRIVETRLHRTVTIREENSIAALEVMSRFATDPHWLIYLPPTMSPSETSSRPDYLEYPTEALTYFRKNERPEGHLRGEAHGVAGRSCRLPRSQRGAREIRCGRWQGRRLLHANGAAVFPEPADEAEFIARVQAALSKAGFWDEFASDWFCIDCELMPWSAKARELLQRQYAPVGAAGVASLEAVIKVVRTKPGRSGLFADL